MKNKLSKETYFNKFKELYENKKVKISVNRNSYGISFSKECKDLSTDKEFKECISSIIQHLIDKVLDNSDSNSDDIYIEELLKITPELTDYIKLKFYSNLNTLNGFNFELITSKSYKLELEKDSVIMKLDYNKPNDSLCNSNSVTFELSKKELKELQSEINNVLEAFDK
ncbi:hypothetical protein [Clostridium sp. BJN0001]|uniref:hypothetical protein n=1 Tax=Clostridium sp. BJN0001 TaxID=2930219 RepID=UPI001FD18BE4|nr:hypothetical protein [Clostridium sp. BJN0001]